MITTADPQMLRIEDRLDECEQMLARIDERVKMLHEFGLKAWRIGLGLCALVLGVDVAPLLGVI
jgi:hypothetical protein